MRSRVVQITDRRLEAVRKGRTVLTTLEGENPGGSIKDHMVAGELIHLLSSGALRSGGAISEISAGSTARSLAFYCRQHELQCELFVPHSLPEESRSILSDLGANLHFAEPKTAYGEYDEFTRSTGILRLNQFGNRGLRRHYVPLAADIVVQLGSAGYIDVLIGGVGTGHSLTGLAEGFGKAVTAISAEPTSAAAVSGIRNLRLESFGENDPCDASGLVRMEVAENCYFSDHKVETDVGLIEVAPSFRVVLGALERHCENESKTRTVFAIGASNRRSFDSESAS